MPRLRLSIASIVATFLAAVAIACSAPDGSGASGNDESSSEAMRPEPDRQCSEVFRCVHGKRWDTTTCRCVVDREAGGLPTCESPAVCANGFRWDEIRCACLNDGDDGGASPASDAGLLD